MKNKNTELLEKKSIDSVNRKIKGLDSNRRLLLGAVGGASALVVWQKPIVNAVLLPAHAQTSQVAALTTQYSGVGITPVVASTEKSLLNALIPQAHATVEVSTYAAKLTSSDADTFTVDVLETRTGVSGYDSAQISYSGTVSVNSGGTLNVVDDPCTVGGSSIDATIGAVSDSEIELNFTSRNESLTVPEGAGDLPSAMCVETPLPDYAYHELDLSSLPKKESGLAKSAMDLLIPQAHAGFLLSGNYEAIAINSGDNTSFNVSVAVHYAGVKYDGVVDLGAGTGTLTLDAGTGCPGRLLETISISNASGDSGAFVMTLDEFDGQQSIVIEMTPEQNPELSDLRCRI